MSCCRCEPVETAGSLGGDTHAVGTRPKWAREARTAQSAVPLCRWGASLAHRQVLETRTRAEVNVRPRLLMQQTTKETEKNVDETTWSVLWLVPISWRCVFNRLSPNSHNFLLRLERQTLISINRSSVYLFVAMDAFEVLGGLFHCVP